MVESTHCEEEKEEGREKSQIRARAVRCFFLVCMSVYAAA